MYGQLKTIVGSLLIAGVILAPVNRGASADSLYEYYSNTSTDSLKQQTAQMGKQLRAVFNHSTVAANQQKIDFAEYTANLKKAVRYATRLATYSDYETDLRFARDNEIFKGLPEDTPKSAKKPDRKGFVNSKYTRMKKNIQEEIETYDDLIRLSLDACETITQNDLSGVLDNASNRGRIERFTQSKGYREYVSKQARFKETWPQLAMRISAQISLWQQPPPSPNDPILDAHILGAI